MRTVNTGMLGMVALSFSATVHAQAGASQQRESKANDRVCEDIIQTGSRIASKRFCGTRSEWDDRKRQDREAVERAQLSPCVLTKTGSSGKGAC
jgi:hypothetical protein